MTIQAVPSLPSNFLVTIRPEITTSNKHWALAWQRPAGVPGPPKAGSVGLRPGPAPSCGPSALSPPAPVLAPRDFGGEMHFAGPDGRAARRGPEFPKCPEPFPWPRRLPAAAARGPTCPRAAGPSRCRARGAAPPPAGRAPVSRASQAAPRPARAQRPSHSPGRSRRPTARGRRRATRGRRPSPARPPARLSPPPARPPARASRPSRARRGRGGGREHARARGAGGGRWEAGPAASVMAHGAAAARCVLSVRSPLV